MLFGIKIKAWNFPLFQEITLFIPSEEDSGEGTDEDIEVEAEIEEKDPVISRRDELSGLALLASRFITAPVPVLTHEADERPIKPKIG